jgi:glycosyltransferase involved in cell wall biosynthesis
MSEISNNKKTLGLFDKSVSLLSWAYNEEDSIKEFLEKASAMMDAAVRDYEIILIDDGSTDRTYEIAKTFQDKNPKVKIFRNEKNLNVGYSSRRAIQLASKEFTFWQTVDWSYEISDLRDFLECLKTYDIVQGVRRKPVEIKMKFIGPVIKPFVTILKLFGIRHLTKRSDSVSKAIVSVINYILIRFLFRVPISDFQNVTFYPTKWIQSLAYEAKSSFANPEGLIKAHWSGLSIKEVPISFIPRKIGEAKGTKLKAITASISDIFRLWFKWVILGKRNFRKKGKISRLNPKEWTEGNPASW